MLAVIFDLDGVIVDSEAIWDAARRDVVAEHGGTWKDDATKAMMGMSSHEWSAYLRDELHVRLGAPEISERVVAHLEQRYRDDLPLIAGATDAVNALAEHWPLGLASSANREVIDLVIELTGLPFAATVSSEEVPNGKPAPDVYLEAAARMDVDPASAAAIEDSSNGLRSAAAAGMKLVAIPNPQFPPEPDALAHADVTLSAISQLTATVIRRLDS